jgi:hypothetical protein
VRGGKSCVTSAGDMRARPFSRFFFGALLLLGGLASGAGGCSQQTEGERCDAQNGDTDDCETGLVCTACDRLRTLDVDRCCPPEGSEYSDPRCAPTNGGTCVLAPTEGDGGEGATTGEAAASSGAAANEGGAGGEPASSTGGVPGGGGAPVVNGGAGGDAPAGAGGLPAAGGAGGESGAVTASGTGGA